MGAAGVLHAAGGSCLGLVQAVVALNPSHASVNEPSDFAEQTKQYLSGKDHSGEFGEGTISHLSAVKAATLVVASQAEYNTELFLGAGVPSIFRIAPVWPYAPSIHEQLGSSDKELFVDNTTEQTCLEAHCWLAKSQDHLRAYAGGVPIEVVRSFLRRKLIGSDEQPMERPAIALAWATSK
jgi:hypothetical protein